MTRAAAVPAIKAGRPATPTGLKDREETEIRSDLCTVLLIALIFIGDRL